MYVHMQAAFISSLDSSALNVCDRRLHEFMLLTLEIADGKERVFYQGLNIFEVKVKNHYFRVF